MTRPNVPVLTAMRFFAALLVLIYHYDNKHVLFPLGLSDFGHESVIFFFVLSGFVLTYAHAHVDGERALNLSARAFLAARVGRILPGYFFGLMVAAPFFFYGHFVSRVVGDLQFYAGVILVPLLLQAWYSPVALAWNGPAWSLSAEWFFYLIYPLAIVVVRAVPPLRLFVATFGVVLLTEAWRQYLLPHGIGTKGASVNLYTSFPPACLPQFMLGVALGLLFLRRRLRSGRHEMLFFLGLAGIGTAIALKPTQVWPAAIWPANMALLILPFCALIYGAAGSPERIARFFAPRILQVLGEASYAIYILHVPVGMWWIWLAKRSLVLPPSAWVDFLCYLSLTLALSVLTFFVIERPSRHWLRSRLLRHATT